MNTKGLIKLYGAGAIRDAVTRLAAEIDADAAGRPLVLVAVLSGAFIFAADLVRALESPAEVYFIEVSSYGGGTSPGKISMKGGPPAGLIAGRNVVVVDDIVDTGRTARHVLRRLGKERPASLRICALLDKPARRLQEVSIDYRGFTVEDRFVVGYGMDHGGKYRQLRGIYAIDGEACGPSPPG